MTADRPDRPRPSSRTATGRHRTVPPDRARARRHPEPARTGDTGPTRRLREPTGDPARPDAPGGSGYREPVARRERRAPARSGSGRDPGRGDPPRVRRPWPDRLLRGLAGILAGGMVVLALGILVVWVGADRYGLPGPGADTVIGHLVGAVVAVAGQRVADRRPDRTGTIAAAGVVGLVALVLGFAWFL